MAETRKKTQTRATSKAPAKRKAPAKSKAAAKPKTQAAAGKTAAKPKTQAKSQTKTEAKKPAAKPKSKRKAKTKLVPPPTREQALEWIGMKVDDWSGNTIGKVSGLLVDTGSEDPKWLILKMGMFTGEGAVPFDHVAEAGGKVWAAYGRDMIRSSPRLKAKQTLNVRQERQLCEHYGVRPSVGRAAELADRDGDDTSAAPAEAGG